MDIMSTKEKLVVDRVGAAYSEELYHGCMPSVSIHMPGWCELEFPVQWYVEVKIFGVILCLVDNYGQREVLPIGLGKYQFVPSQSVVIL